jgi:hypothetical protein
MPRTSKAAKLQPQHSDSDGVKPAPKRQKLDSGLFCLARSQLDSQLYSYSGLGNKSSDIDIVMVDDSQHPNYDPNKNAKLKGRKRFKADLTDLQEAVKSGLVFDSLVVKS